MLQPMTTKEVLALHVDGQVVLEEDELGFLMRCTARGCNFAYRPKLRFEAQRRADMHADHHKWADYGRP